MQEYLGGLGAASSPILAGCGGQPSTLLSLSDQTAQNRLLRPNTEVLGPISLPKVEASCADVLSPQVCMDQLALQKPVCMV